MAASERAVKLAKEVLAKCMAYDPHFPHASEATIMAWAEHISLKNPDRDDMLAAVAKFYENSFGDVKPLPASITSIARQIRNDRLNRGDYQPPPNKAADPEPPEPVGAKKISMAEWEQLHGMKFPALVFGRTLPSGDLEVVALGPNPLRVHCPHCNSGPGSPCTIPGTQDVLSKARAHESRCAIVEKRCGGLHHETPHTTGCVMA